MKVLTCWHDGHSMYVTIPAKRMPCNLQQVANILLCDVAGMVGSVNVRYEEIPHPTIAQIREGRENWSQTFEA